MGEQLVFLVRHVVEEIRAQGRDLAQELAKLGQFGRQHEAVVHEGAHEHPERLLGGSVAAVRGQDDVAELAVRLGLVAEGVAVGILVVATHGLDHGSDELVLERLERLLTEAGEFEEAA